MSCGKPCIDDENVTMKKGVQKRQISVFVKVVVLIYSVRNILFVIKVSVNLYVHMGDGCHM